MKKIEQVINEIDFLIFHFKNFNVIIQSTLIFKIIKNEQNINVYTKSIVIITNKFLNNYQFNDQRVAQNELIVLNHNSILKLIAIKSLRRIFTMTMRNSNIKTMKTSKTRNRRYKIYRKYATKY